jgi:hypothetical protein
MKARQTVIHLNVGKGLQLSLEVEFLRLAKALAGQGATARADGSIVLTVFDNGEAIIEDAARTYMTHKPKGKTA